MNFAERANFPHVKLPIEGGKITFRESETEENHMKDSKFSYTAVRIYNTDLIEELEKTFNRTETSFASNRSQFLVHLIELGLGSYKETLEGKRSMPNEKPFDLPHRHRGPKGFIRQIHHLFERPKQEIRREARSV